MATFLETQIADTKTMIENVTAAINSLLLGGHSSYELDTGQSSQGVKRLSLEQLRKMRKDLFSELQELETLNGDNRAVVTVRADF
jgi:hypothetical protein